MAKAFSSATAARVELAFSHSNRGLLVFQPKNIRKLMTGPVGCFMKLPFIEISPLIDLPGHLFGSTGTRMLSNRDL
jgi:hypothetical protein